MGGDGSCGGDRHQRRDGVPALERLPPAAQAIEDHAEAEQVAAGIDRLAAGLLGGHVGRRADDRSLLRQRRFLRGGAGQAEVEDLDAAPAAPPARCCPA